MRYAAVCAVIVSALVVQGEPAARASGAGSGLIAYERHVGDGETEIFVMNADGTGQRRLTTGCCFDWAPDGRRIAFVNEGVWVINVDGTGLVRLAKNSSNYGPDWSPDGERIAFDSRGSIFVVKADGTGVARLTSPHAAAGDFGPRWSPNGRRIAFERYLMERGRRGTAIFVIDVDGAREQRLTDGLGHGSLSWSPGGRFIAYNSWSGGDVAGNYDIYVVGLNGSSPRNVTQTLALDERQPQWSPRGTRIVFVSEHSIHTAAPDGRRHRKLTRGNEPMWSGNQIVFARLKGNNWDLHVMSASGRNPTNLTNTPRPTQERSPAWSP